jgi:hypothetical protein
MANGFTLDSEQLQQSPQQQQLAAQQPTPAQGQGGNLLSFLGNLGTGLLRGIEAAGASYAATQGRPQMLEAIQARKQQENLIQQLQSISKQEMEGPFGGALSQALNMGDLQGAQKIVSNIPKFRELEKTLPALDLSEAERQSVKAIGALDPQIALDLTKRILGEKAVLGRQKEVVATTEAAKTAREERKLARQEAKLPGTVIAKALREGTVMADDLPGIVGVLQSSGVKLPTNENEARLFASRILESPEIKKLIPKKDERGFFKRLTNFFSAPQAPAAAPMAPAAPAAPTMTAPATPQLPGAVRKFNPATGQLE